MLTDSCSIKNGKWSVHGPSPCSPGAWSNKNVRFMCFPPNFNIEFLVKYRVKNNDILSVRVACCNEVKTMKISLKRTPVQSFIHHYLLDKINRISRIRFVKKQDCVYIFFGIFASEFLCFCHFFFNILIRSTAMNLHKITTRIMSKYFCMHGFYTNPRCLKLSLIVSYCTISSQDAMLVSRYLYTYLQCKKKEN